MIILSHFKALLINLPIYVDIKARSIYCHGTRNRRSETQTVSIWSSETDWTWILIVKPKSQSHSLSFKKGNCTRADTKNLGHQTHQYFTFSYFRIYERVYVITFFTPNFLSKISNEKKMNSPNITTRIIYFEIRAQINNLLKSITFNILILLS